MNGWVSATASGSSGSSFHRAGGRVSLLRSGSLPAPLHFLGSFAGLHFLGALDKIAVARGLRAIEREHGRRAGLDRITMLDWLREKRQTPRAIGRFWQQVLVSAINEDLDRMAAGHGFQVFWQGFLARPDAYQMGLAAVPLGELYAARGLANTTLHLRAPVDCFAVEDGRVTGAWQGASRTPPTTTSARCLSSACRRWRLRWGWT